MISKAKIKKLRRGVACCITSAQTHLCPKQCPYTGEGGKDCQEALLRDVRRYIIALSLEKYAMKQKRKVRNKRQQHSGPARGCLSCGSTASAWSAISCAGRWIICGTSGSFTRSGS